MLWAYAGVYALVFVLGASIGTYNSLVDTYQRVRQGYSLVDVQLKRRFDLISNLLPTVQAYAEHEEAMQQLVSTLRGEVGDVHVGKGVGRQLLAVAESYPALKSEAMFLQLQRELQDTEDRIALARSYYLEICSNFEILCSKFPNSIIANLARFRPPAVLEFTPEIREAPTVKF